MFYPIADAHCDLLSKLLQNKADFSSAQEGQMVSLQGLKDGGVKLQVFAAWYDPRLSVSPFKQFQQMAAIYWHMLKCNPELRDICSISSADTSVIKTTLTVEDGEVLEGNLDNLYALKEYGVTMLTLTWNRDNLLSSAAGSRSGHGLTSFGRQVVREMNQLGIAVDVSHLSDSGIEDVLSISDARILASHSNCRAVYPCVRSLPDHFIKAIADRGGVIGINFFHKHLGCSAPSTHEVISQVYHLAEIGGIECCAIGSDFDGIPYGLSDLKTSADFQILGSELEHAGFSQAEVKQILYENLHNFVIGLHPETDLSKVGLHTKKTGSSTTD